MSAAAIACDAEVDRRAWDAYVRAHPQGSFFHLSGWGVAVRSAYGYEPVYITARRNGVLAGVLPLIDVASPFLGRSLVSTAFTVGGGPLADDETVLNALLGAAEKLGRARRVRYVECRSENAAVEGWTAKRGAYARFAMALPEGDAEALAAVPRKRRAEIRKALAAAADGALSVRFDGEADVFYALYASALHAHGTPVFPKKFLRALMETFRDDLEIAVVEHCGQPAASLLSFYFRDAISPYYIGASRAARGVRAHDLMYWAAMRRAAARGMRVFDFGRSRVGGGAYDYKKHWGAVPEPLVYGVKLIAASAPPNVNPDNPKFALFARAWPRLPLFAANALGPVLAPNFP